MTAPRYAITLTLPIHDGRDAIVGSRSTFVEGRVFQTAALAHKIAGLLEEDDYNHGGDGGYQVFDLVARKPHYPARTDAYFPEVWNYADEECPF